MFNPRRLEEAREWLRYAAEDLEVAEMLASASTPKPKQALFHAQQAAEKILKAFLVAHDHPYPLTHSLGVLADACLELDEGLGRVALDCVWLTQYAVRFRYPGEAEEPSLETALKGLSAARAVHAEVVARSKADS